MRRMFDVVEGTWRGGAFLLNVPSTWQSEIDGTPFSVTLSLGPCHDDMSGDEMETVVVLGYGDRTYRGCGVGLH